MNFLFEFLGPEGRWEAIGVGEGDGDMAVEAAIADLAEKSGGGLPAGEYRYMPGAQIDARWRFLELDPGLLIIEATP